ncbi:hypothetical protein CKO31_09630 [Thiohalocapsa halophila]|uniref:Antitoxin n=1 Tax=Thiohalocapsa halophila TaxID=69359 RepID=A0ABS1CGF1_9GAMM|nr:hypothetical protein [Thiohalocapsa halophila]MBK1630995.1 hypothetical protein [Thiohalocapsa halophila]
MRTTLDIDSDIIEAIKERARREHRSAGAVLSDLARLALTEGATPDSEPAGFYGFRPLPADGRVVSDETVERLRDELGV